MGWFDEQILERKKRDAEDLADAMEEIRAILTGQAPKGSHSQKESLSGFAHAMKRIFAFYRLPIREFPQEAADLADLLEALCRPTGMMTRSVELKKDWYKDASGAYLGSKKDGTFVALLPGPLGGYRYYDPAKGGFVNVNGKTAAGLETQAVCFYKPFPQKKLTLPLLLRYAQNCVPLSTRSLLMAMTLVTTLVGMLSPKITYLIFSQVITGGSMQLYWSVLLFSVCISVSTILFDSIKTLINGRISTQISLGIQAATMARVLSLPPAFFQKYSAGELTTKIQNFNSLCTTVYSAIFTAGLGSVFSLIYIVQIFQYAPALVVPSLCITLATLVFSCATTILGIRISRKRLEVSEKKNGLTYALLSGIQKIRLAGAEKRAFTQWTRVYAQEIKTTYGVPLPILLSGTVGMAISLAGNLILYYVSVTSGVAPAEYYAFTAAYGMVSGAFSALVGIALQAANIRPTLEQVKPIMETLPEISPQRKAVTRVKGGIELNRVSFRYSDTMPWVLEDLSVKIQPGQYVAVVGKTGCGKSTLIRLLLGFETPQKGAVYYDGTDIATLDLRSLRRKIGVVLQNSKPFHGDIFSNITLSAPWLGPEEAWAAAEAADIAEDIRKMPMGMHTVISEGGGGISGGQRQRLMIARAIAHKPRILIFDEATSALDNISQKKVSQALDHLNCTRIVIAHRLSTIRHCDRILVLDQGRIVEDGTYDSLLAAGGLFTELVQRQKLDTLPQ